MYKSVGVTLHPAGSNIYSTNGTKLIKILISGDQYLDASTFRIMFDLTNMNDLAAKELRPLGGPWTFFRRMRVLAGNQLIEDIDNYNRCHQLFSILTSSDSRANVNAEAFGQHWDIRENAKNVYTIDSFPGISGGQSQTVLFKPLAGILNQIKMTPLRYCPITIELQLVDDPYEPIVSDAFDDTNTSVLWQIQNVQTKCDALVLDNHLDYSFTEHLLNGGKFPVSFSTLVSQTQSLLSGTNGQQKVRLNVTRALSRLQAVFVTLDKEVEHEAAYIGRKPWNDFYSQCSTMLRPKTINSTQTANLRRNCSWGHNYILNIRFVLTQKHIINCEKHWALNHQTYTTSTLIPMTIALGSLCGVLQWRKLLRLGLLARTLALAIY